MDGNLSPEEINALLNDPNLGSDGAGTAESLSEAEKERMENTFFFYQILISGSSRMPEAANTRSET